ncbi:MAG: hypothetical protein HYY40_01650 [Bacteroidetes bacterium]|nr:hypothetical protein [Bacteroidota bacterium]
MKLRVFVSLWQKKSWNLNSNVYIILILFLFFSCKGPAGLTDKTHNRINPDDIVIFPPPPDTPRIQFLTAISNSRSVTIPRSKFAKYFLGSDEAKQFSKPYGISIRKGKIYICDTGVRGLEIIDLEKRTFNYFVPPGRGQLILPINCFVDEKEYLYISDAERRQIIIFDEKRKYMASFGDTALFKPTDVFVTDNKIWVTNIKNNRINVYDKDSIGKFLYSFPDAEYGSESYLYSPVSIHVTDDKVYVSDIGGYSVKVFGHDGKYLMTIGSYGKNPGQFVRNKGIAVDRDSNVYVVDAVFQNVQIFSKNGNLLMFFGGEYKGPGYMWLPAKVTIDYDNLKYFTKYVSPEFDLKFLILVTNQYGPDKINVYGFVEPAKTKKIKDSGFLDK